MNSPKKSKLYYFLIILANFVVLTLFSFYIIIPLNNFLFQGNTTQELTFPIVIMAYVSGLFLCGIIGCAYFCYQALTDDICDKNIFVRK